MNKIILGIIVAAAALGGLVWLARPQSKSDTVLSANSNGVLAVDEGSFDFGSISMAAGTVAHRFKIRNTGSESVSIEKIYTSCMCTTAALEAGGKRFGPYGMPGHASIPSINQAINPNEEAVVEVVFDPAAHGPAGVGRIERVVVVENNAGKPIEFGFVAVVTP